MNLPPLNPDSFSLTFNQKFELEKLKVLIKGSNPDDVAELAIFLFTQNCVNKNLLSQVLRG